MARRPRSAVESVDLDSRAADRVLAEDVAATLTQPPFDASAMDGYAVRAADVAGGAGRADASSANPTPAGRSPATVGPGEAVRIFTGAAVPKGADAWSSRRTQSAAATR